MKEKTINILIYIIIGICIILTIWFIFELISNINTVMAPKVAQICTKNGCINITNTINNTIN